MSKTPYIVGAVIFGVTLVAFVITMVLTSVIITSSIDDTWIKPGEQIIACQKKEFTVNPEKDGVIGHIFPTGIDYNATEVRIANEVLDGTVTSKKMFDVTRFHANTNDVVTIEFESASYSKLEIYYRRRMSTTAAGKILNGDTVREDEVEREGNENTIAPKGNPINGNRPGQGSYTTLRIVVLRINGTGLISGDAVIPEDFEYAVGVVDLNGTTGHDYSINITYARKYYTSNETVNCTSGVKTTLNSEKNMDYCVVFEMEYDGPITDPEASKNKLGVFCPERYKSGDITAICMISVLFFFGILIFGMIIHIFRKEDKKKKSVEMS